jgi:homocysteine S-methyltransferase
MVQNFNRGIDPSGKAIGDVTRFLCACGAEPAAYDYEREIHRLELKKQAGAQFIMTQPVYEPEVLERFLNDVAYLDLPVLVGLLPLASHRNAEFLHHEVPGMAVPESIRARMKAAGSGPEARREGVLIAQEALLEVKDRVVGAYIMPPFGRYEAALEILECIPGFLSSLYEYEGDFHAVDTGFFHGCVEVTNKNRELHWHNWVSYVQPLGVDSYLQGAPFQ